MGTKNNPGKFDCHAAAEPDEPMFVLLGRDPMAGFLVQLWADLRKLKLEDPDKVEEAEACAAAMDAWAETRGKKLFPPKEARWSITQDIVDHTAESE
jgi:hypothetical protein